VQHKAIDSFHLSFCDQIDESLIYYQFLFLFFLTDFPSCSYKPYYFNLLNGLSIIVFQVAPPQAPSSVYSQGYDQQMAVMHQQMQQMMRAVRYKKKNAKFQTNEYINELLLLTDCWKINEIYEENINLTIVDIWVLFRKLIPQKVLYLEYLFL
jgi:hypothetical protein